MGLGSKGAEVICMIKLIDAVSHLADKFKCRSTRELCIELCCKKLLGKIRKFSHFGYGSLDAGRSSIEALVEQL